MCQELLETWRCSLEMSLRVRDVIEAGGAEPMCPATWARDLIFIPVPLLWAKPLSFHQLPC